MRYILWTGGWDSTYLLAQRAREGGIIQPVYEKIQRDNLIRERKARQAILPMLRRAAGIRAKIMDPIEVSEESLPTSPAYDKAYETWKGKIAPIYRSLGKMGMLYPGCEIGIEAPAPGTRKIGRTEKIMKDGGLILDDEGRIMPEKGDPALLEIFGRLSFPLLHTNAAEMLSDVKAWGYLDIFRNTWTCDTGLPKRCGVCHNCETKWKYGDTFRWMFSPEAQRDHAIKVKLSEQRGEELADQFMWYVMDGRRVYGNENLEAYFKKLEEDYASEI